MQVSGAHTWLCSQQVLRCRRCTLTQRLSRIPDSRQMCDALATHMTFVSLIKKLFGTCLLASRAVSDAPPRVLDTQCTEGLDFCERITESQRSPVHAMTFLPIGKVRRTKSNCTCAPNGSLTSSVITVHLARGSVEPETHKPA